ncbi:MAG TPA: hypothetical protein VGK73_26615 [Polyangiaceae bacterium]
MSFLALGNGACSGDSEPGDTGSGGAGVGGGSSAGKSSAGAAGSKGGSAGSAMGGSGVMGGSSGAVGKAGSAGSPAGGSSGAGGAGAGAAGSGGTGAGGAGAGGAGSGGEPAGGGGQGGSGGSNAGAAGAGSGGMAGAGMSGSAGKGGGSGSAGAAGVGNCPTELVGWATLSGDNVNGTTGGGNATPVRPTSAQQLADYAGDATPRVIEIQGTFDVPSLEVASNKTLVGIGNGATINGSVRVRGYEDEPITNVILKNFHVNGATTADEDAVQIYFAHHVWIDHLDIYDGPDGNLDLTHAVNWVTVSWTKFRYTSNYQRPEGESSDHRFSSLVGHSDNNSEEDNGRLKVSFHHNWWAEGVIERMPRVRFGQVHVFNNYFSSQGNNYCVRAGRSAQLLIEGNYFDRVNSPHQFNDEDDEATASITARNNVYNQTTGDQLDGGGGPAFTSAPYAPTIEPADGIPNVVQACAGPR